MVFPSVPLYLDPPNWNQQGSTDIVGDGGDAHQPQPEADGGAARPTGSMAERARLAKIPQPEVALKCPRCDSTNTKFCYFNNYSLTQPRHFCKTCRRYWTRGGALRSVPVGGGCRRNKRSNKPSKSATPAAVATSASTSAAGVFRPPPPPFLATWHHVPEYGFGGIQPAESMGLEQWRIQQIQQFPFLGGLAHEGPSVPAAMVPGLYPFEGELPVKMEESSQTSAAAAVINFPRQLFGGGRNDGQMWPGVADGGGGQGGRWTGGDHISGFSSSSTGNLL